MTKNPKYITIDFCRIIIPKLDITNVNAKEDKRKVMADIFTIYGALLINFTKKQSHFLYWTWKSMKKEIISEK